VTNLLWIAHMLVGVAVTSPATEVASTEPFGQCERLLAVGLAQLLPEQAPSEPQPAPLPRTLCWPGLTDRDPSCSLNTPAAPGDGSPAPSPTLRPIFFPAPAPVALTVPPWARRFWATRNGERPGFARAIDEPPRLLLHS